MNTIIENVLQLSRRKQSTPQNVELGTWLDQFLVEFSANMHTAVDQIEYDKPATPVPASVDPSQLHQTLWNLVQNGLEHGGTEQTPARIRIRTGMLEDMDKPFVEVIDNGPGVSEEQQQQIFEPFFTTAQKGTGLGLYIARELCESNGAKLRYYDNPGGGSCFRIELPAGETQ